jgi:DNA-binding NtrC family response regulator
MSDGDGKVVRKAILLVDDEPDVRDVTALLLRRLGFDVLTAGTADEALALAQSPKEIHLLMTDLSLTGAEGEGEALAASFTRIRPQARVLFISGSTEFELPESHAGPARAFLGKPFSVEDLRRVTSQLLA